MTTKTKTALIVLATLIIGIMIGALGSGAFRQQQEEKFERMPPDRRFFFFMKRVIQPTDQQREQFDRILAKYSEQISKLHEEHQNEMLALYDSMRTELQSILTEEQRSRVEDLLAKGTHRIVEMRLARLTRELGLDENQQRKIKEILKQLEMPHPPPDLFHLGPGKGRPPIREHFLKMQEEIEKILTPEQLDKYHRMKSGLEPPFWRPPFRKPGFERAIESQRENRN